MQDLLLEGLVRSLSDRERYLLSGKRIGIAGAGGIGSNVAFMLARSGVRRFVLLDDDIVEPSNLNRQQFFPEDVGRPKVGRLPMHCRGSVPASKLPPHRLHVTEENATDFVEIADIWGEAFDVPEFKRGIVESAVCRPSNRFGIRHGRLGIVPMQKRELGLLTIVGDFMLDGRKMIHQIP